MFIARRMVIFASEDIGNADLRALPIATACLQSVSQIGMPEARIILGQTCTYLATAPKSNASYQAIKQALKFAEKYPRAAVPPHISQRAQGYQNPHNAPNSINNQLHWPPNLSKQQFYHPTAFGDEQIISQRLKWWKMVRRVLVVACGTVKLQRLPRRLCSFAHHRFPAVSLSLVSPSHARQLPA